MAQSPTVEIPKRLPLLITPASRDNSGKKDAKLVNCYMEIGPDGEPIIIKRPGTSVYSGPFSGAGAGIVNWLGDIYTVFGTTFYKNGGTIGTVDGTGGIYHFDFCLGATPKLQLGNGVFMYNYDASNGLVKVTDGDFPAAFVKGFSYLDGTTYVMTAKAAIQGSAINDPTSWDPLNTITAQIEPDKGIALAKQLVYVVAFKQWSTEVFYDAGNATGSPLGPVLGAKSSYGCFSSDSIQNIDGSLFWLSTNRSAALCIVAMTSLAVGKISTPYIERLLNNLPSSTIYSWQYKGNGHRFYVITFTTANITLAYDIDSGYWHQWADTNGNYVPIVASSYIGNANPIVQHESDAHVYYMSNLFFTDYTSGVPYSIPVDIVTPNYTGNTYRRKNLNRMDFVGDQVTGSVLNVRVSDDDYQTWSNFRQVDLGVADPNLTECGTFIKRAFHFRHTSNTELRLKAVDLQIDLGTL